MVDASVVGAINQADPKFKDVENVRKFDRNNYRRMMLKKLSEVEQEFTKKHKPYDFRSAKADFEFMQEDAFRRGKRKGARRVEDVEVDIDFEKYGDAKRFNLIKSEPIIEQRVVDNVRVPVTLGTFHTYVSVTGTRISVKEPLVTPEKKPEVKA